MRYHFVFLNECRATTLLEGNATYHHPTVRGNGVISFFKNQALEIFFELIWLSIYLYFYLKSNPTLSRITVCCRGYQRNAHIVRKCDPICESECVNGICFSPNECICYPDHAKNLGGHCVPTCPIGMKNMFE